MDARRQDLPFDPAAPRGLSPGMIATKSVQLHEPDFGGDGRQTARRPLMVKPTGPTP